MTLYRQELKAKILETAMHEFSQHGIKKVKMDDIARLLGISKRTLYEIYQDKEELLFEGIRESEESIDNYLRSFAEMRNHNAMDVIIEFYHIQMDKFSKFNPAFFVELHKYPKITQYLNRRHNDRDETSSEFFRIGIEEGYFRADVNYEIISTITQAAIHHIMETQLYHKYPLDLIFKNVFFLFIRGFCTEKGVEALDKQL